MKTDYKQRNKILKKLGFCSYKAYLKSELWSDIKKKGLLKHGNKCKICRQKTNILHHKDYLLETLLGKNLDSLIPLCRRHHKSIEFGTLNKHKNQKVSLPTANAALGRLLKTKCRFCQKNMYINNICKNCKRRHATFLLDEQAAYSH